MISLLAIIFMVPAILLGAFGSIYLKKGAKKFTFNLKKWKDNLTATFGLFLFSLSMISYLIALKFGDLSILYPLSAFTYVAVALISKRMLNENMNNYKWLGIILIIIGSFVMVL